MSRLKKNEVSMRNSKKSLALYKTRIEPGNKIAWPRGMTDWKIGQRVFFTVIGRQLKITDKPISSFDGRIYSARVSRKFNCKHFTAEK